MVDTWREGRGIDLRLHYSGRGDHRFLHATAYQTIRGTGWVVVCRDSRAESGIDYPYGETMPLTCRMAKEVAVRFVTGRKIPKRLEWR